MLKRESKNPDGICAYQAFSQWVDILCRPKWTLGPEKRKLDAYARNANSVANRLRMHVKHRQNWWKAAVGQNVRADLTSQSSAAGGSTISEVRINKIK